MALPHVQLNRVCSTFSCVTHTNAAKGVALPCSVLVQMEQILWCVDLDLGYSDNLALCQVMSHVTGLQLNTHSGVLEQTLDSDRKRGFCVLLPHLLHANLTFLYPSVLLQVCKANHIAYNHKVTNGAHNTDNNDVIFRLSVQSLTTPFLEIYSYTLLHAAMISVWTLELPSQRIYSLT